jgi:hypothetical protein
MDPTTKSLDDLEAVRTIAAALAPFKKDDQERIIRWAREKVGLSIPTADTMITDTSATANPTPAAAPRNAAAPAQSSNNIKQFVDQKAPKSDMHFAAVVAYYHRFNAPAGERKSTVAAEDLQDACRKADRERLKNPGQTLINAFHAGLLDREGRGEFGINSVGENLVAMALPEPPNGPSRPKKRLSKIKVKPAKRKQKRD